MTSEPVVLVEDQERPLIWIEPRGLDVERLAHAMANETDSATEDERRAGDLWSLLSERLRAEWRRRAGRLVAEYARLGADE